MTNQEIVQKLWNLCNVLRDDGITYHQYVNELTFILFLKMAEETGVNELIPRPYQWKKLADTKIDNLERYKLYKQVLTDLGNDDSRGIVYDIYKDAYTNIRKPIHLEEIILKIDGIDWYTHDKEDLGDMYEGLLEKNATEVKSGAGQYFTPRPLIDVMVELINPKLGEYCNDPASGTFGFMVSAARYVKKHNDYAHLDNNQIKFQNELAFSGCELVADTHRLALMNALLHDLQPKNLYLGDTLSDEIGLRIKNQDVVLSNPPFGTKKGGERTKRNDITFPTSNKQLNFLQHIYRSLKADGKARAAVVLPDNVLTADGDGSKVRQDLMKKCRLHTILRLPKGIFYALGVKTNVLFFSREAKENDKNTPTVWFYDMRTNMDNFGKRTPFTRSHFDNFVTAYTATDRQAVQDERWSCITAEQIAAKGFSLDFGLIRDENIIDHEELPEPTEIAQAALDALETAAENIRRILLRLETHSVSLLNREGI
jgi:type I restriction enzyme M protein